MPRVIVLATCVLAIWGGAVAAQAQAPAGQISPTDLKQVASLRSLMDIPTIADQHPDVYYRKLGVRAYQDGDKVRALRMFLKSSSYADKIAQAMVATMYWNGEGTPSDHPRAYAWMDLAADRGYRDLLIQRERYWNQLSDAERKQALAVGREVYAEYGDERGLRRLQLKFSAVLANVTGSHAGFLGNGGTLFTSGVGNGRRQSVGVVPANLQTVLEGTSGTFVDNDQRYASYVWNAKQYARLKDIEWKLMAGHVEVGPLQVLPAPSGTSPSK